MPHSPDTCPGAFPPLPAEVSSPGQGGYPAASAAV